MNVENFYSLLTVFMDYVNTREKETALFAILDLIYENDLIDIVSLRDFADSEENDWMVRKMTSYIKQNGLDDEEDEW
jgi:hypothetical protein